MSLEETDEELDSFMKMKDYLFMQTQGDVEVKNMFDKVFSTGYCILSKYMQLFIIWINRHGNFIE